MKIRIHSTDGEESLFEKYLNIAKKYSTDNNIEIREDEEYSSITYIIITVDSFDFLPKLEKDIVEEVRTIDGLIFSTVEEGFYDIEIYDGYRE